MPSYSPFFQTLYDEQEPIGSFGRGTHYSVLRAVVFHDDKGDPLPPDVPGKERAFYHDFAVIWDEDHDTRVIEAIHRIYTAGLLSLFTFYGENKAILTCLTSANIRHISDSNAEQIQALCSDIDQDYWQASFGTMTRSQGFVTGDEKSRVLYLSNIDMLWQLGPKTITSIMLRERG